VLAGAAAEVAVKGDKEMSDQQTICAKCEALKIGAQYEYERQLREARYENKRRMMEIEQFLSDRLMEIYLEHEGGEHAEDTG
jgi:hypothetical protein